MSDASYAQTSFLGGEISEWSQGRFDRPQYKIALAKASNVLIVDEGAATRRPGFRFLGTTLNGKPGRVIPFDFSENEPYDLEFTDNAIRMWDGVSLVTTNDDQVIESVTNATPAVFTLSKAVTWVTDDQIYFTYGSPFQAVAGAILLGRQFTITMLSPITFTVVDSITGESISGASLISSTTTSFQFDGPMSSAPVSDGPMSGSPVTRTIIQSLSPTVHHALNIATPYSEAGEDWHKIRAVQGLEISMLLHTGVAPQALQVVSEPSDSSFATFSYSKAFFQDGPYLDPPASAIATPSAASGVIQLTIGYPAYVSNTVYGINVPVTYNGQDYISLINNNTGNTPSSSPTQWQALALGISIGPSGFVSTDVGRMMRLFSAPQNWDSTITYSAGDNVAYNGEYFTSLIDSNMNNEPDISTTDWTINTSAAIYTWGTITQVLSANSVQLQVRGAALIYTTSCPEFSMGAWSDTTGWPTCGCYQGGRFWFGGAIANRTDSSQSDSAFNMAPTLQDGTVTDACGISYTFNSNSVDQILWMEPQPTGIMIGTQKGEYLLSSGTSNGPITPSSIAESPATKYGSANILPVKTGLTMCFVQRYSRRLIEYLADVFSQRFYGPDLSTFVRHIGKRRFQELAYQQVPVPVVWARMGDGSLVGTTYRRTSLFSNQEPEFNAWHQHPLGSNRLVESIAIGPADDENFEASVLLVDNSSVDTLSAVTNDPATNIRFVEKMTPLMDETDPLTSAWFLDSAATPPAASIVTYGTPAASYVRFYGLNYLNGRKVSIFAAAIDCGDYYVQNGQVDVPLGVADAISGYTFDTPQFDILQPLAASFASQSVFVIGQNNKTYSIPCVIGFNYQTQGQLCRPMMPVDTGAKNGPGFAKKRRQARYGINLSHSLGVQVGTLFNKMVTIKTTTPMGNNLPYLSTFSGIKRDTLKDDETFDSMLCWQTVRPYPATVTTFGGFITTEDI